MQYSSVTAARFLSRPNRFVALVEQGGRVLTVHVKNTGRCAELLQPGTTVYLTPGQNPARKTSFDLIAVEKPTSAGLRLIINIPTFRASSTMPGTSLSGL